MLISVNYNYLFIYSFFSQQNQFSYIVVEELVDYLTSESVKKSSLEIRSYVVDVLTETATIVAKNASPHINTVSINYIFLFYLCLLISFKFQITKKIVNCLKEFMFLPGIHSSDERVFHESIVKMIGKILSFNFFQPLISFFFLKSK